MEYKYGMKLRGFSPMCQPMNGLIRREDSWKRRWWDVLVYDRKLTEEELRDYDLEEVE